MLKSRIGSITAADFQRSVAFTGVGTCKQASVLIIVKGISRWQTTRRGGKIPLRPTNELFRRTSLLPFEMDCEGSAFAPGITLELDGLWTVVCLGFVSSGVRTVFGVGNKYLGMQTVCRLF